MEKPAELYWLLRLEEVRQPMKDVWTETRHRLFKKS